MPQLSALAVGAQAGGTALQAVGGIQSMNTADSVAKYDRDAMERRALASRMAASYDASRIAGQGERVIATARAGRAASGIDPGSGSSLDVEAYSRSQNLQDQLVRLYGGQAEAQAADQQSKVIQAMRGPNRTGAMLGIGGTILGGAGRTAATYQGLYG